MYKILRFVKGFKSELKEILRDDLPNIKCWCGGYPRKINMRLDIYPKENYLVAYPREVIHDQNLKCFKCKRQIHYLANNQHFPSSAKIRMNNQLIAKSILGLIPRKFKCKKCDFPMKISLEYMLEIDEYTKEYHIYINKDTLLILRCIWCDQEDEIVFPEKQVIKNVRNSRN